jgi:EpsI family protein
MTLPGGWAGKTDRLDREIVATLAVDDYVVANYSRAGGPPVNLYSAWYDSQSGGQSTHSPRTCIPGGGWAITDLKETPLTLDLSGQTVRMAVNRAVIQKGEARQLVYYWFAQRGRVLTSELDVKRFILLDSLRTGRSDGALLRLVTLVPAGEDIGAADQRLGDFLTAVLPRLHEHVPD